MYTSCYSRNIDSTASCHSFTDPLNDNCAYHQRHKLDSHFSISTTNINYSNKSLVGKQSIDLNNNNNNNNSGGVDCALMLKWNNKFKQSSTEMGEKPDDNNMPMNDLEIFNYPLTPLSTQPAESGGLFGGTMNDSLRMSGEEEDDDDIGAFRPRSQTWGGEKLESMHKCNYKRFNQPNQLSLLTAGMTDTNTTGASSIRESTEGCGSSSIQSIDQLNDYGPENDDSVVSTTFNKDTKFKHTAPHKSSRPISSLVSSSSFSTSLNTKTSTNSSSKKSSRRNPWGQETYAELIESAITSYPNKMATLQQIYEFISFNYSYFGDRNDSAMSAGWKNSIRHNLSLHDKFIKCPKRNDNVKSSLWAINHNSNYRKGRSNSLEKKKDLTPRRKAIKDNLKKFYPKSELETPLNIKQEPSVNMDTDEDMNSHSSVKTAVYTNSNEENQDTPVITSSTNPNNPLKIKIALKNSSKKDQPPKSSTDTTSNDKWCSKIPGIIDDDDDSSHNFFNESSTSNQGYTPQTPYKPQVQYSGSPLTLSPPPSMCWPQTCMYNSPSNSCQLYNSQHTSSVSSAFSPSIKSSHHHHHQALSVVLPVTTTTPTTNTNNNTNTTTQELTSFQYPHSYSSSYNHSTNYPVPFQNAALEYSKFIADLFIDDFDD